MSELKAYDLVDIQDYRGEVYIKSKADKVIEELKHQRDGAFGINNSGLTLNDLNQMARKVIERQKYKRCLAMS